MTDASGIAERTSPIVQLDSVRKSFGETVAVDDVDLEIARGEFFSLLGASGCGKTTLLRLMAGLEQADAGRILLDGIDMTDAPAWERPVNTVFQSYALFPHMTVARNVAFGLRQEGLDKAEIERRVAETLAVFGIESLAARRPHEISGGQRQRVALCRALVKRPKILLLDEPLAALDRRLREQARFELKGIQARLGITFIMVTHDQDEAMSLSTRAAVMNAGRIVQIGTPRQIYDQPVDRFVAGFVGDADFLEGKVVGAAGGLTRVDIGAAQPVVVAASQPPADGTPVSVMIRPERIQLAAADGAAENRFPGTVVDSAFLGNASLLQVRLTDRVVVEVRLTGQDTRPLPSPGDPVILAWPASALVLLCE